MFTCYFCGAEQDGPVYRNTICSSCSRELKICFNCQHYSPSAPYACLEPAAEEVRDKEKSNFCDYFKAGDPVSRKPAEKKNGKKDAAKKAFNDLFSV